MMDIEKLKEKAVKFLVGYLQTILVGIALFLIAALVIGGFFGIFFLFMFIWENTVWYVAAIITFLLATLLIHLVDSFIEI